MKWIETSLWKETVTHTFFEIWESFIFNLHIFNLYLFIYPTEFSKTENNKKIFALTSWYAIPPEHYLVIIQYM